MFTRWQNLQMHPTAKRLYEACAAIQGKTVGPTEVAGMLGLKGAQLVKNWEARGVSRDGRLQALSQLGIDPNWVETGEGRMFSPSAMERRVEETLRAHNWEVSHIQSDEAKQDLLPESFKRGSARYIPDFAITKDGLTTYVEVKAAPLAHRWRFMDLAEAGEVMLITASDNEGILRQVDSFFARKGLHAVPSLRPASDDDLIRVPRYHNGASMGPGSDVLPEDAVAGDLVLHRGWLERNIHPRPSLDRLTFITAYGDSMAPKIQSGNILLVDTGHTAADINGIYVLEANKQLFVKRVSRRLDGRLFVSSDNEPNVAEELRGDSPVHVKGRVVYVWKGEAL